MRSLEQARECWLELQQYESLRDLKDAVRLESGTSAATSGLRSACWKAFLLFDTLDKDEWQRTLSASRSAYNSLRSHFFRYIENPDDVGAGSFDPLSQDSESSPWSQVHKDQELRAEILQDVERCMPDNAYFRRQETQRMLLDILFVFCKLNPDVGYRQGMHEIVAPVLWAIENDAIDVGDESKTLGEDSVIRTVFDTEHIEHDSFAVFGQVMQNAKVFYLSDGPVSIAARSRHIFEELLPLVDRELKKHLESLDVVPQVFLIRWIRLLFGREFDFESVLTLWDVIFAEDASLEIVDHICLAMLLRIRWHILDADYNNALGILLRYPEQDKDVAAQTFGLDAMYLRTHMTTEGGSYLVLKYTGRPLVSGRPSTPPALQRNITTFAVQRRPRTPRSSRPIEAMLHNTFQNTAKNIYARGEKLGIGKAVRNAVDEVHKKAQEIRDAQTPSSRPPAGQSLLLNRVKDLESRNKKLSELLASAVNELWDYQKLIIEGSTRDGAQNADAENVEKLSAAIAKVQFVQVYLDEPSLALPEEEPSSPTKAVDPDAGSTEAMHEAFSEKATLTNKVPLENASASQTTTSTLADPSTFEDFDEPGPISRQESVIKATEKDTQVVSASTNTPATLAPKSEKSTHTSEIRPLRPSLESSPFSYMLGQENDSTDDGLKATGSPRARSRVGASLFGGGERTRSTTGRPETKTIGTDDPLNPGSRQDDDFDMSSLQRAKASKKP